MELSPALQKLLFVAIVVVLGGFGYVLVGSGLRHHPAASPGASASSGVTPAASSAVSVPPSVVPAATTGPAGTVNIYDWLPFTQQDLTAAAAIAVKVGVDYNTFNYTQNAAAYAGQMTGLITPGLAATLAENYSMPGIAKLRDGEKQVSSGTAVVSSLRAFGPTSLTFIVTATQRIVSTAGTTSGTAQYAITVTGSGTGWQVSDIELKQAGNN